jgi:hypothetical protein
MRERIGCFFEDLAKNIQWYVEKYKYITNFTHQPSKPPQNQPSVYQTKNPSLSAKRVAKAILFLFEIQ